MAAMRTGQAVGIGGRAAWVACLVVLGLAAAQPARAQQASAALSVSVVVVRSCSVGQLPQPSASAGASRDVTLQVRCGRDMKVYSLQPGATVTAAPAPAAMPTVSRSAGGESVTVLF